MVVCKVGDSGTILSLNSSSGVWEPLAPLVAVTLRAIDIGPLGNGVIVGDNATVLMMAPLTDVSSCNSGACFWVPFSPALPWSLSLGRSLNAVIALADGSVVVTGN